MANYPNRILIEKHPNNWKEYYIQYEHEGGGCYYSSDDKDDVLFSTYISLYPNGRLTFLWNGIESTWNVKWKVSI